MAAPRLSLVAVFVGAACAAPRSAPPPPSSPPSPVTAVPDLRPPEAFSGIAERDARSRAIFLEASRVILHARCVNCHPAGDSPHQRDGEIHDPPVARGASDRGVPAMECGTCHQDENATLARVPGAPSWRLAPRSMAWEGRTPAQVCAQIKDPARNGNRTLAALVDHAAHDPLVAWGWAPGADRAPVPGTQERFGALVAAWVETGAACPEEASR